MVRVTAPATSKDLVRWAERLSPTTIGATRAPMTPIGTLMKKIQRQPGPSVSRPPRVTPATAARPLSAPQAPSALLRAAPSSKLLVSRLSAAVAMNAAPRPWAPRAPISIAAFCETPASREEPANRSRPVCSIRRRPRVSASLLGQQQEAAEEHAVGRDHVLESGGGDVELVLDGRQGDVHDRHVEEGHEAGQAEEGQDEAGAADRPGLARRLGGAVGGLLDGHVTP